MEIGAEREGVEGDEPAVVKDVAEPEPHADVEVIAEPEADVEVDAEPEAEADVEVDAEPEAEADIEAEVERVVSPPSVLDRIHDELDGVERALARVDDGSYGTCQACGAEIPDERLATEPIARFCAEHQTAPAG